jgi:hypothetical protein
MGLSAARIWYFIAFIVYVLHPKPSSALADLAPFCSDVGLIGTSFGLSGIWNGLTNLSFDITFFTKAGLPYFVAFARRSFAPSFGRVGVGPAANLQPLPVALLVVYKFTLMLPTCFPPSSPSPQLADPLPSPSRRTKASNSKNRSSRPASPPPRPINHIHAVKPVVNNRQRRRCSLPSRARRRERARR